jgi:hypothetical protein
LPLRASLFYLQNPHYDHCQTNENKNQPFFSPKGSEAWVKNPEHFFGGSILLSKGGSGQMSVKDLRGHFYKDM